MKTIWLGMSGGVDSSAAAWLLKQQGYTVVGITLRLHGQADRDCADARRVCDKLGMEHRILDGRERFRDIVVSRFIADYYAGRTPNPCVVCNRRIKFGWMLDEALRNGADGIATGHYANVAFDPASGRWQLRCSHSGKDQSYMLYGMTQRELAHTLFPLGALTKAEVRALALENGFGNARKRDSQDICFVPDGDYAAFVERHTGCPCPPGDILDEAGRVVGRHRGYIRYTVGQRRGLGIAAPQPLYVRGVCPARNTVTVAGAGALYTDTVDARELNWIACDALGERPVRLLAKLRYRQPARRATAWQTGPDTLRVRFDEPQRAPAPGQALVLYDGGTVVGGGVLFSTV